MGAKKSKALKITLNVATGIVIALILFLAVVVVMSRDKGYISFFGKVAYAVRSDSMEGDQPNSFNKYDLIFIDELTGEQVADLQEDDVISFYFLKSNASGALVREVNTHRIVSKTGSVFYTKGDNAAGIDDYYTDYTNVIGKYNGSRVPLLGGAILFVQSSTGFLLFVVVPSFLIVGYCLYIVIRNYNRYQAQKAGNYRAAIIQDAEQARTQAAEEKAQAAEQKLADMQRQLEELQKLAGKGQDKDKQS